ncbi:MAG: hypothetical protein PHW56_09745 [Methanosarcinaceae archaeon]|nr:hypothetical protein [Methanosarcinaceae archaeon]
MRLNTCIKITGEEGKTLNGIAENTGFISRTYLITAWIHPLICKKAAYGEPPPDPIAERKRKTVRQISQKHPLILAPRPNSLPNKIDTNTA